MIEQLELPDLEDPLAYLLGRYRRWVISPITADGAGALAWTVHLAPGAEGSRFTDQATAAGTLRFSVGTAPFGFGVDDPATRGSRL